MEPGNRRDAVKRDVNVLWILHVSNRGVNNEPSANPLYPVALPEPNRGFWRRLGTEEASTLCFSNKTDWPALVSKTKHNLLSDRVVLHRRWAVLLMGVSSAKLLLLNIPSHGINNASKRSSQLEPNISSKLWFDLPGQYANIPRLSHSQHKPDH